MNKHQLLQEFREKFFSTVDYNDGSNESWFKIGVLTSEVEEWLESAFKEIESDTKKKDIKILKQLKVKTHLHLGNDPCSAEQVNIAFDIAIEAIKGQNEKE